MTADRLLLLLATLVFSTQATSEGLRGAHVCIYEDSLLEKDSAPSNDSLLEDYKPLLIKRCCPGYETLDRVTCQPAEAVDPFRESRFTVALGALLGALIVVALLSTIVAYTYHYRFQNRGRRTVFEEVPQGIPNPGFTYTEKPKSALIVEDNSVPDLQLR
ncbi:hypothetical protein QR680_009549 [Steinernema hermaphroditum]|uniref:EMI domain-containing protein n=1 Tax=Steinernema hermaphroditum TaxID=289476 RepID=A0AA39IM14_9BILA|nr:hypothetical protein QR680_009549 [Steinernema hermaphroditum]